MCTSPTRVISSNSNHTHASNRMMMSQKKNPLTGGHFTLHDFTVIIKTHLQFTLHYSKDYYKRLTGKLNSFLKQFNYWTSSTQTKWLTFQHILIPSGSFIPNHPKSLDNPQYLLHEAPPPSQHRVIHGNFSKKKNVKIIHQSYQENHCSSPSSDGKSQKIIRHKYTRETISQPLSRSIYIFYHLLTWSTGKVGNRPLMSSEPPNRYQR